jgi:hypothetical protein
MRHHRFFFLTHLEYHVTFYNIYDHRSMSLSHTLDDMQENFFICMKKSENDSLIEEIENLMKMMNWKIENLIKIKSARFSFSINHFHTIIIECHFRMNLMTCKKNFSFVWKNSKTIFWMMNWMMNFHQVLDLDHYITFYNIYDHC